MSATVVGADEVGAAVGDAVAVGETVVADEAVGENVSPGPVGV